MVFNLTLMAITALFGLVYFVGFVVRPDDMSTALQKAVLCGYWLIVGVALGTAIPTLDMVLHNSMATASVSVAAMTVGIIIGHSGICWLRQRVARTRGRRAYLAVMGERED